jgi:hypothetical protein
LTALRSFWIAGCAAILCTLFAPAMASAGPLQTLNEQTFHNTGYFFEKDTGLPQAFALFTSARDPATYSQTIVGSFGAQNFVGVAYQHTYTPGSDTGTYDLFGSVSDGGLSGAPLTATIVTQLDRNREIRSFTIGGTIAGVPFSGISQTVVNPLYGAI